MSQQHDDEEGMEISDTDSVEDSIFSQRIQLVLGAFGRALSEVRKLSERPDAFAVVDEREFDVLDLELHLFEEVDTISLSANTARFALWWSPKQLHPEETIALSLFRLDEELRGLGLGRRFLVLLLQALAFSGHEHRHLCISRVHIPMYKTAETLFGFSWTPTPDAKPVYLAALVPCLVFPTEIGHETVYFYTDLVWTSPFENARQRHKAIVETSIVSMVRAASPEDAVDYAPQKSQQHHTPLAYDDLEKFFRTEREDGTTRCSFECAAPRLPPSLQRITFYTDVLTLRSENDLLYKAMTRTCRALGNADTLAWSEHGLHDWASLMVESMTAETYAEAPIRALFLDADFYTLSAAAVEGHRDGPVVHLKAILATLVDIARLLWRPLFIHPQAMEKLVTLFGRSERHVRAAYVLGETVQATQWLELPSPYFFQQPDDERWWIFVPQRKPAISNRDGTEMIPLPLVEQPLHLVDENTRPTKRARTMEARRCFHCHKEAPSLRDEAFAFCNRGCQRTYYHATV